MFTDTKNLANLTANTSNAAARQQHNNTLNNSDDKFKLKKMWKPILRLMSRKSSLTTRNGAKRDHNSSIPNNVHLNNASQYHTASTNKDLLNPAYQEDESYTTHKLPMVELLQTQQQISEYSEMSSKASDKPLEFISKASIDKTPLDTCTNCVYGRNCHHKEFHPTSDVSSLQPLHYFDAEEGCFVWSDGNSGDVDENALREWLWHNSWQFAENATMC